ncbi:MAG: flagellar biosynthetic protein FliO [Spirochaetales bacterium]|nr:flagellar biosynthetic protein FliO [Spirochaetales bacterium]
MNRLAIMLAAGIFALAGVSLVAQENGENSSEQINAAQAVDETTLIINTENQPAQDIPEVSPSAIGIADLVRTVVVLLLVIGAIYLVMYILRRFSASSLDGSSLIKVVGSRGLMKDSAVHLLEVGNQVFLVGTGNSAVNLISEITDQETIDNIRLNLSEGNNQTSSFAQRIAMNLGLGRNKTADKKISEAEGFIRSQRDRLKDL